MSSKSNALENELLQLQFNNVVPAGGTLDTMGTGVLPSVTPGSLYISLHTADPGEGGTQATSEMTITNYARIGVARSAGGWTVSSNQVSNTAQIRFPAAGTFGSGPETARFFQIGTASSGAGDVAYTGHIGEAPIPFTAASANTITAVGHTFVDNDEVFVFEVPGDSLPTSLTRGLYFVITPTGDTFTLETSIGGGPISFSADGSGYIAKVVGRELSTGDVFTFEASNLLIFEN